MTKCRKRTLKFKLRILELARDMDPGPLISLLEKEGVPRSTFLYWLRRDAQGALDPRTKGRPVADTTASKAVARQIKPVLEALSRIEAKIEGGE